MNLPKARPWRRSFDNESCGHNSSEAASPPALRPRRASQVPSEAWPFHRGDVHSQASPACGSPSCQTTRASPSVKRNRSTVNCDSDSPCQSNLVLRCAVAVDLALNSGKGCGLEKLQPVIDAVVSRTADPDERRARGTHSLAEFAATVAGGAETPRHDRSLPAQVQPLHINALDRHAVADVKSFKAAVRRSDTSARWCWWP